MITDTVRKVVVVAMLIAMVVGVIGAALQPLVGAKAEAPTSEPIPFVVEYPPAAAATVPAASAPVEMPNPFPALGPQAPQQ